MIMKSVFGLSVIMLLSWPTQAQQLPANLLGEWVVAEDVQACRLGDFDKRESDSLIKVGRRQIEYWESVCTVRSVSTKGNTTSVRMTCSGEGETWTSNEVLSVQKIGGRDYLVAYRQTQGYMSAYSRCR